MNPLHLAVAFTLGALTMGSVGALALRDWKALGAILAGAGLILGLAGVA